MSLLPSKEIPQYLRYFRDDMARLVGVDEEVGASRPLLHPSLALRSVIPKTNGLRDLVYNIIKCYLILRDLVLQIIQYMQIERPRFTISLNMT